MSSEYNALEQQTGPDHACLSGDLRALALVPTTWATSLGQETRIWHQICMTPGFWILPCGMSRPTQELVETNIIIITIWF